MVNLNITAPWTDAGRSELQFPVGGANLTCLFICGMAIEISCGVAHRVQATVFPFALLMYIKQTQDMAQRQEQETQRAFVLHKSTIGTAHWA